MTTMTPKPASSVSGPQTVLSYESIEAFDVMFNKYVADFQPETEHELFTVRQMADSRWKLNRLSRIEAAAFEDMLLPGQPSTPDHTIATALLEKGDALTKLQRYRESLERSYYRAHKEFQASRKHRHVDVDAQLNRALEAYIKAPIPLTRDVVVRHKTNSPAPATAASAAKLQNELPRPATAVMNSRL